MWKSKCKNRIQDGFWEGKYLTVCHVENIAMCRFVDLQISVMILSVTLSGTVYIVEEEQRKCISWHSVQISRKVFLNYRNSMWYLGWGGIRKYCCHENWIAFFDSSGRKDSRKSLAENGVSHDITLLRILFSLNTQLQSYAILTALVIHSQLNLIRWCFSPNEVIEKYNL